MDISITKETIIKTLGLTKLSEVGGYFSETYRSASLIETDRSPSARLALTSIYYLLTDDQPISYFHIDKSDVIHFYHGGHPITFLTISVEGLFKEITLGMDVKNGHLPQLLVKGGTWKAAILKKGDYGLLSETVSPGFHESDEELATPQRLKELFPHLWGHIMLYVRNSF